MVRNYLKILFRNFARNKAFTLINISGLTLGITCSLIMFLIVKQELSFNRYHKNADYIHRIGHVDVVDGREYTQGGVPLVMPPAVKDEIVGLKNVTLISHERYGLISVGEKSGEIKYYEENPELVYIEPSFFEMFDWAVLEGSIKDVFEEPNIVALNETLAKKYFPNESAIGRTIRLNKSTDLKVVAVLEDAPLNSDFPFGIFISMQTKKSQNPDDFNNWGSISSDNVAFVELEKNVTPEQIDAQFPDFIEKHWDKETREERSFLLSSLNGYHFDERFNVFSQRSVPKVMLYTYTIIGIFLIVAACVNFINMSTAMSVKRSKEVGMRKVLGSSKKQLTLRFLGETFVITLISVLLSIAATERLLPLVINDFIQIEVPFHPLTDVVVFGYLLGILIVVTLVVGLYPALILSRSKPINALKGTMASGKGSLTLRRVLVWFQFILCQLLIFGTIVAVSQMNFFLNVDMGYDKEGIINITIPQSDETSRELWNSKVRNLPGITSYSLSFRPPFSGSVSSTNGYHYASDSTRTELDTQIKPADHQYMDTYGLRLLAGRWLSESDTINEYVINEAFMKKMGIKDPNDALGELINVWGFKQQVVGVVKDFHTGRLDEEIDPVSMFNYQPYFQTLGLRVNEAAAANVIKELENIWYDIHEEYEFSYIYVAQNIKEYYEGEEKMSQMLTVFALIAIFIGCIGLYGLVSFVANQKAKEIGIRKVLGATVPSLVGRFSKEFLILVGLAFLLSAPLGYLGMNAWLDQYAYSIKIGPVIFIAAIGASVLIAMVTTGYRSVRAATANPVDSLRDE